MRREASTLVDDLKGLVEELEQAQQMSLINVELVDDELARVYANSNKSQVYHRHSHYFLFLVMSFLCISWLFSDFLLLCVGVYLKLRHAALSKIHLRH